jgi:hypothetical protein
MDSEIGLFHNRFRPNARQEFLPCDNLSCALAESNQDVERTAAKPDGFSVREKRALLRAKSKWTKEQSAHSAPAAVSRAGRRLHLLFI